MKRFIAAAAIGIMAISPAMAQKAPADGGRAYSGAARPAQPSSSSSSSSSSKPTPNPVSDPVEAAAKAGSAVLGIFGR